MTASVGSQKLRFIFVAVSGILEAQALLLCASIRRYAGKYSGNPITVVSPRAGRRPSRETISIFDRLAAEYLEINVASVTPEYGTSFRVHASAEMERRYAGEVIAVMDSDMVFTGEPDLDLLGHAAAARPVDVIGIGTTGNDDPRDENWRRLCATCAVDYASLPWINTTVDNDRIKASYNGGLLVADTCTGIFGRTEEFLVRAASQSLSPKGPEAREFTAGHGRVSAHGSRHWGSAQACWSLAAWGAGQTVRTLPATLNFPIHIPRYLERDIGAEAPLLLHYHHLFAGDLAENPIFKGKVRCSDEWLAWLSRQLPLKHRS